MTTGLPATPLHYPYLVSGRATQVAPDSKSTTLCATLRSFRSKHKVLQVGVCHAGPMAGSSLTVYSFLIMSQICKC